MTTLSMTGVAFVAAIMGVSAAQQAPRTILPDETKPTIPAEPAQSPLFPNTQSPYDSVFREKLLREAQRLLRDRVQEVAAAPQSRIVCGMTVIQADPAIDPKMVIRAPENGPDQKIVRIEPPACHEPAPRPH